MQAGSPRVLEGHAALQPLQLLLSLSLDLPRHTASWDMASTEALFIIAFLAASDGTLYRPDLNIILTSIECPSPNLYWTAAFGTADAAGLEVQRMETCRSVQACTNGLCGLPTWKSPYRGKSACTCLTDMAWHKPLQGSLASWPGSHGSGEF